MTNSPERAGFTPPLTSSARRLGPVGSLIAGEVLLGVIDADPVSQRSVDPGWRPSLPGRQPGRFTLTDLLAPA